MDKRTEHIDTEPFSEEEKDRLRQRTNRRISQLCNYAALLVILVTFASFILGQAQIFFAEIGIMAAIALLAIAAISGSSRK